MAENITNGTDFIYNANSSHMPNANVSNVASTFNGPNIFNDVNNGDNHLLERRASFLLAIAECVLGAAEFGVGVNRRDESMKAAGATAIHNGVESGRILMETEGRVEGMVEEQVQRVVTLTTLLYDQGLWQWVWDCIQHHTRRFWVLWVLPWVLGVLGRLGYRRVAAQ